MPVYEFQCQDCGNRFSEIRKMGDFAPGKCEKCGSANVKKLISGFSSSLSTAGTSCSSSGGG